MKRRENLSEAASKTLFGTVFDLSDLARLGRLLPSLWITGNGLVAPEKKMKVKKKLIRKIDSQERPCNYVACLVK